MIDFDANFFCLDELLHVNDLVRRENLQTPHKAHVFHYKILFPCLSCNKLPLQKNPLIVQYVDQKLPTKKLQMHLSSTLSWIHSQQEACAIYKILFTSAACQQPLILALLPQLLQHQRSAINNIRINFCSIFLLRHAVHCGGKGCSFNAIVGSVEEHKTFA